MNTTLIYSDSSLKLSWYGNGDILHMTVMGYHFESDKWLNEYKSRGNLNFVVDLMMLLILTFLSVIVIDQNRFEIILIEIKMKNSV